MLSLLPSALAARSMVLSVTDGDHRDVVAVTSGQPEVLSAPPYPTDRPAGSRA